MISVHVKIQFACLVLVEHVLIAYGPLRVLFFCYSFIYFADLSTTNIQNKSANIKSGLPMSWSSFLSENPCIMQ